MQKNQSSYVRVLLIGRKTNVHMLQDFVNRWRNKSS